MVSDIELDGWALNGPDGLVYVLYRDGRLFRWQPQSNQLVLTARLPPLPSWAGPHVEMVLGASGRLIVGRCAESDPQTCGLFVFEPGRSEPIELGNPVPGHCYLTALTVAADDTIYGLSTDYVYGLAGTPIHLYSLRVVLSSRR